jgi:hypothetical protein
LIRKLLQQILPPIAKIGSHPDDSDEVQLQKTLLASRLLMFIGAGALCGLIDLSLGEYIQGIFHLSLCKVVFKSSTSRRDTWLISRSRYPFVGGEQH